MAAKKKTAGKKPKKKAKKTPAKRKKAQKPAQEREEGLLDMEEAIEMLQTTRPTFYRWLRAGKVKGMKVGRQWRFYREDLERFLKGEPPRIDLPVDIDPLIETLEKRLRELKAPPPDPSQEGVVKAVNLMILLGAALRASDIHLAPHFAPEPGMAEGALRYRVDGVLHPAATIDARLLPALVERWKVMASCDPREKSRPQDGRVLVDNGATGRRLDIRVSFLPTALGESLTARILEPLEAATFTVERLGFDAREEEALDRWANAPWGLVVVTGPTGSGKTTTLYAGYARAATPERKALSIEDPVEILFPWTVPVQIRPEQGLTFSSAIRAVLRSDPDVVLIGELRDRASVQLAQQMALTGHLVFTSLHAGRAIDALRRLVDVGGDPYLTGESLKFVMAQRLLRTLCPACSSQAPPTETELGQARELTRDSDLDVGSLPGAWRKPAGCPRCGQTGYRGRKVVAESIEVTPEIARALRQNAPREEIHALALAQGMQTLEAGAIRSAARGETALSEVFRVMGER